MTDTRKPIRPDCFEFAMDFLGDPEEAELRNYIEALEAQQRPAPVIKYSFSVATQPGKLVERVAKICAREWDGNPEMWGGVAEALIREVAAALLEWHYSDQLVHTAWEAAKWLEQEAGNG